METFLARVVKVYPTHDPFFDRVKGNIPVYNQNKSFANEDARLYGAITYAYQNEIVQEDFALPFDKNNFTFPIVGETVTILKIDGETFYLPYSSTPYVNYREKTRLKLAAESVDNSINDTSAKNYNEAKSTGGSTTTSNKNKTKENSGGYVINEKIKFLEPKTGDTIISGRVGNSIRFSEFNLTEDGKTSSPGIFIRNKQNPELDSKPIGTLVGEDINKDGTSVYITSNKIKVPFKETTKKQKVAFQKYPNSTDFTGDQLFVNSDRIILSAKAKEFIIFGKGNTGIITDGKFSVDSIGDSHIHSDNNIVLQTKRNIVLATDNTGYVWLGKVAKTSGKAGEEVQRMVLAGELIALLEELIDEINQMVFATGVGPTSPGAHNKAVFTSIKKRLGKIQSSTNFLSK